MATKNVFSLDCEEAEIICDKLQYKEAGFLERLKLSLHFRLCAACKEYRTSNTRLSHLIKKARIVTCTKKEKEAFLEQIKKAR